MTRWTVKKYFTCEEIFYLAQIKGWSRVKYRNLGVDFSLSDWYISPESCPKTIV